jgi:hypothetical protein
VAELNRLLGCYHADTYVPAGSTFSQTEHEGEILAKPITASHRREAMEASSFSVYFHSPRHDLFRIAGLRCAG